MPDSTLQSQRTLPVPRAISFACVFAVLQLTWQSLHGSSIERLLIHDGTVRPAAQLVNWLTPDVHARAVDFSLRAPGGGLNILNGCEGMEALFLLIAAFAVAPLSWRNRVVGLLIGSVVVFLVNQIRILALFYTYRTNPSWFSSLHGTVAPIAVVLAISASFYTWLNVAGRHAEPT